jgi:hypothetical protein
LASEEVMDELQPWQRRQRVLHNPEHFVGAVSTSPSCTVMSANGSTSSSPAIRRKSLPFLGTLSPLIQRYTVALLRRSSSELRECH